MLDRLFREIVTKLELASIVPAAKLDSEPVSKSKATSGDVRRIEAPHLYFTRRYEGCRNDDQRRAVVMDAMDELRAIRYSRKPNVDRETLEGRLEIGRDPRPVSLVAYVFGFSERHIWNLRKEAKEHDERVSRRKVA